MSSSMLKSTSEIFLSVRVEFSSILELTSSILEPTSDIFHPLSSICIIDSIVQVSRFTRLEFLYILKDWPVLFFLINFKLCFPAF